MDNGAVRLILYEQSYMKACALRTANCCFKMTFHIILTVCCSILLNYNWAHTIYLATDLITVFFVCLHYNIT